MTLRASFWPVLMVRLSEFGNHHRGRQLILAVLKALSDSSGITQVLACFGHDLLQTFREI